MDVRMNGGRLSGAPPAPAGPDKFPSSSSFGTVEREETFKNPSSSLPDYPSLHALVEPHLLSFNSILEHSLLDAAIKNLDVRAVTDTSGGHTIRVWLENVQIGKPILPEKESYSMDRSMYPSECRERGITYEGKMTAEICFQIDNEPVYSARKHLGNVPIMLKSNRCHLEKASPAQLVKQHEDGEELGGYFIVNGIERLIRLVVVTRRNHVLAVQRNSLVKKGPLYTPYSTSIRCVRDDQTSQTISLHYLSDGNVTLRFSHLRQEYLIPVLLILRALKPTTNDREIFNGIVQSDLADTFLTGRVERLLREYHQCSMLYTRASCLSYLGSKFQVVMRGNDQLSEEDIGRLLLKKMILVHIDEHDTASKFNLLLFMMRKLYTLVEGKCSPDNPDSPMHHEILLPGHLYNAFIKEKLDELLTSIRTAIATDQAKNATDLSPTAVTYPYYKKILSKCSLDIGKKVSYFLATGNISSASGMNLQQLSGYTIIAERLNFYRYLSHFRSVHRGAFFSTMKTTSVRKLMPESWGFLCPVHTPDGAPCGLLTHLSHKCIVVTDPDVDASDLPGVLTALGVQPCHPGSPCPPSNHLTVILNGSVVGYADVDAAPSIAISLRKMKVSDEWLSVPDVLEVALILPSPGGLFPGLFLFTTPSRMLRPVHQRTSQSQSVEMIGTLEQVFMDISIKSTSFSSDDPSGPDVLTGATHAEIEPTHILSVVANMTPFCDFNQSPRNMYQCQMSKQSMGTPFHCWPYRTDNKLYKLHTGQSPIVRPSLYSHYGMDMYPNGANAVVAVISYTGYDMEDAMIINKSSFERGFGHGTIYKNEFVDLKDVERKGSEGTHSFQCTDINLVEGGLLDTDGLPPVGRRMCPGEPFFSSVSSETGSELVTRWKGMEEAFIDQVRLLGDNTGTASARRASVKFRIPRNPVIGDKFSSRHGQKGVLSQKWPLVDMPWSESGITPDVIINPHAFPSRMTIGMFVESMAGKAGALHGIAQDATPFQFSEKNAAHVHFGEQLCAAGFNYYGNEPMYSGVFGIEMRADIYLGVVYYQRLRHMVSDKFQVRTHGPVHNLTHQPIKGRKRAGGIRFGEMERDSLLAHGASFLLHDRLMNCSDYTQMHACTQCGCILSVYHQKDRDMDGRFNSSSSNSSFCLDCQDGDHIVVVALPYVYRYLCTELMSMNIRLKMDIR